MAAAASAGDVSGKAGAAEVIGGGTTDVPDDEPGVELGEVGPTFGRRSGWPLPGF